MVGIQQILCPIDFSDVSRRALDHAVAFAKWYQAMVSVLYVHRLSTPVSAAVPFVSLEALQPITLTDVERTHVLASLDDYVAADRTTVTVETVLDEAVDIAEAILSRASSLHADLITLGTHGRSGFQRLMLGSITEKVVRRATCPVLAVPPRAQASEPRAEVSLQQILCPVDFSESSARSVEYAVSLARQARGRLTVLHVLELPPDLSAPRRTDLADYRSARFDEARRYLAEVISAAGAPDVSVDELLLVGRPYREILSVAAEQEADLIVMGVQGRGALDSMFFGSTTNHVIRQATCPVLTLPSE